MSRNISIACTIYFIAFLFRQNDDADARYDHNFKAVSIFILRVDLSIGSITLDNTYLLGSRKTHCTIIFLFYLRCISYAGAFIHATVNVHRLKVLQQCLQQNSGDTTSSSRCIAFTCVVCERHRYDRLEAFEAS